jgi:hypothetical protein
MLHPSFFPCPDSDNVFWLSVLSLWLRSPRISGKVIRRINNSAIIANDRSLVPHFVDLDLPASLSGCM